MHQWKATQVYSWDERVHGDSEMCHRARKKQRLFSYRKVDLILQRHHNRKIATNFRFLQLHLSGLSYYYAQMLNIASRCLTLFGAWCYSRRFQHLSIAMVIACNWIFSSKGVEFESLITFCQFDNIDFRIKMKNVKKIKHCFYVSSVFLLANELRVCKQWTNVFHEILE